MIVLMAALFQTAAADAQPPTVQAMFESAVAAYARSDFESARATYAELEARLAKSRNARSLAVTRIRLGAALAKLGREDEAVDKLALGIAGLPAGDGALQSDRYDANWILGGLSLAVNDLPGAAGAFAQAVEAAPSDNEKISALGGLARATMFDPDDVAITSIDQALALIDRQPGVTAATRAQYQTLKGRAQLNHGRLTEARKTLTGAMQALGGLTFRVNYADLVARSDLAIAALLAGDKEDARRYLAYTGAGRGQTPFSTGADMPLPDCGGPAAIRPDDVVVVEFGIGEDGAVIGATPVYASRLGPIAPAFARQVATWSWTPEQLKDIPILFRMANRVELRCSTRIAAGPEIEAGLAAALDRWLNANAIPPAPDMRIAEAQRLPLLRAERARRMAASGNDALALIPILIAIGGSPVAPAAEANESYAKASRLLAGTDAPVAAKLYAAAKLAEATPDRGLIGYRGDAQIATLRILLADPAIAADPLASGTLRLAIAQRLNASRRKSAADTEYRTVANDQRLSPNDPLKIGALVRLASLQADHGDLAAARAAYEKTGLSAQQCALIDAKPIMKSTGFTESDYPQAAAQWGFEGWVRAEYDITPAGTTDNVRAVISYPPFTFDAAVLQGVKRMTFTQTYRPEGSLGCGSANWTIRFRIP